MITPIEGKLLIGDDIYITNATELPYSLGTPEITWQQKGLFHGGIDLVGWRNLTKRGGQYYIHGNPMELAIVAGDTTGKSPDGDIISFEKTIVKAESENKIVVSLIGKMTYFLTCSDRNGRFNCGQKTETAIFQDTEQIPRQIDATDSGITITKTKYNFSELNRTYLEIDFNRNLYDRYNYSTQYGFIEHIFRSWHVEKTEKGIYYANETVIDTTNSANITRARDTIEVSEQLPYTITASGFYTTTNQSNESYVIRELNSGNQFSPFIIGVFLIFFVIYKYCKIILTRRF